ncbi:iron-containing alcohol dehydrogenase [Neomoorella thermoacetica]|uniref:iron-containing alcohol dehydrogenase n=1 Tax=Neomoorella thermoacetica TaxID=1525 RepID=UPI0008FAD70C|nr:iron-containing alcohol dehydrogenase [Moorella thermoacetica]OIQ12353.1 long-chain primary alcohol dehydrogenase AdhA [Moorella thermoacetica]
MWETKININEVREIRAKTTVYFGVGAIKKIDDIAREFKEKGYDRIIVITGKGAYKATGAWEYIVPALNKNQITYIHYDQVTPNPTVDQVDEATKQAREFGARAVLAIGGGSPIDAAKSVAVLLSYPDKNARQLYQLEFTPVKAAPIIAINLTHGTGTEADRFAVVSIPEKAYKPAIAYDCIYPLYSIDDPAFMVKLPSDQTAYVSVDALNHVVEAATSKVASPYTIILAKETVRLIARYLPQALSHPADLTARYYLLYASLIAGIAFDNGLLHFTHALEHPLSAVKPELAHGLGLGMLLPAVVKQIYPATPEVLAEMLEPIVPDLKGVPGEAEKAASGVAKWLAGAGITMKLKDAGFQAEDIARLTDLAFTTPSLELLLSMAPVTADRERVKAIYQDAF